MNSTKSNQSSEGQMWTDAERNFMLEAFVEARRALDEGEIPVGCVLVRDSTIVARGSNKTNETRNGTRHAEFIAIDKLIEKKGAISLLGFKSVTFGCPNDKFGGNGSIISVHESGCGGCGKFEKMPAERQYMSRGGLFSDEAVAMLKDFYESGNPNAPKPHRRVLKKLVSSSDFEKGFR